MAVTEKVVIKVEIDADISKDLALIERRIKALDGRTRDFNKKVRDADRDMGKVGRQNRDLDKSTDKVTKRFDKMKKALGGITSAMTKFVMTMSKFSFIALAAQIGLFTAGLLFAKAALITGRAAVSAYQASLRGLSVVAAGVATALAVAAAAIREFQEAQLSPFMGGGQAGRRKASALNRSMSAKMVGLLGGEASGAITSSFARAGVKANQSNALARQLFNITGGDAKAAQSLAAAFAGGDVKKAVTAVSGAAGFQKDSLDGVSSIDALMSLVGGGGATSDAFQGVSQTLATTVIGTLKTEFAGLKGIFADIGEPLLAPFRDSFLEMSRILREDFISMAGVLEKFGAESFAPSLVKTIDKISEFLRSNIINNIGNVKEMGQSFVDFFKGVRDFFESIGSYLVKLEPAADVVIEMFKAMGGAAGGRKMFQQFSALVVENAEKFKEFGAAIGNVIGALFDQQVVGQNGFFSKLPMLISVLNVVAEEVIPALFNVFSQFFPLMEKLPDALSGLADVLNFLAPIIGEFVSAVVSLLGALPNGFMGVGLLGAGAAKVGLGKAAWSLLSPAAKTGAKGLVGKAALPLGAVLGAIQLEKTVGNPFKLGYDDSGSAYKTGKFTPAGMWAGAGVGAGIGAAIGSFVPVVGTAMGAFVGAVAGMVVGGILEGIAAWRGSKELKKKAKENAKALAKALFDDQISITGSGSAAFNNKTATTQLFLAAQEAGRDDEGKQTFNGDTREFRDFLKAIGVDPNSVDRDDTFKALLEGKFGETELKLLADASQFATAQVNNLADALNMAPAVIEDFLASFNIDVMSDYNEAMVAGLIQLSNLPDIDRSSLVLPDFSTSEAGINNRFASASAILNTLIGETSEGTFDDATISDFVDRFATAEVASGMDADIAGLSGLKEIREKVSSGQLTSDVLDKFGIQDQEMRILQELEDRYALGEGGAESLFRAYSSPGFNIESVDTEINRISTERTQLKAGLLQGDISSLASVLGKEGFSNYINSFEASDFATVPGGLDSSISGLGRFQRAGESGDYDVVQEMLNNSVQGGAQQATIDYLIESGDLQGAQLVVQKEQFRVLELIEAAVKVPPVFNISGAASETNLGSGTQITFDISVTPGSERE